MGLPSQSPRAGATGRTFVRTHRKRRFRLGPLAMAFVLIVGGVALAFWLTSGTDDAPPDAETTQVKDDVLGSPPFSQQPSVQSPTEFTPQPVPQDEPVTIPLGTSRTTDNRPLVLDAPSTLGEALDRVSASTNETVDPPPSWTDDALDPPESERQIPPAPRGTFDRAVDAAEGRIRAGDPVAARVALSEALQDPDLGEAQRSQLRARLTELNQELLFSPTPVPGDPLTRVYEIASGDRLSTLPGKLGLAIDWRLIQRINQIPDPNRIRLGQKLKVVSGPFHAVVDKSDYRLDVYTGAPDSPNEWVYIRSFRVGLGEDNSTPTGEFVVKRESKLINPHWVNPRTGERFDQNDPENPIGEHWIGIDGIGPDAVKTGYGIHGTIDPDSIGGQESMGCVRLHDEDVAMVYELLVEGISRVSIVD